MITKNQKPIRRKEPKLKRTNWQRFPSLMGRICLLVALAETLPLLSCTAYKSGHLSMRADIGQTVQQPRELQCQRLPQVLRGGSGLSDTISDADIDINRPNCYSVRLRRASILSQGCAISPWLVSPSIEASTTN